MLKLLPLALRNLIRRPLRTILVGLVVATTIFIFSMLLSLDHGLRRMVDTTGDDLVLTVFEKYKACPPYSRLPVHYEQRIDVIDGVDGVMPVRFLLSNCQTTTDLVAVHGVDPDVLRAYRQIEIPESQYAEFRSERGAAIVGRLLAEQYKWRVGDQVVLKELGGISFVVRGIFRSPGSSLESVILVDREYLEYSIDEVGVATMFLVRVDGPEAIDHVTAAVDRMFSSYETQTKTSPEKSFIAGSVSDFEQMVSFSQFVAYGALALLLVAVGNSVSMSVRERSREIAIFRTLGYRPVSVTSLVVGEAMVVCGLAAVFGIAAAIAVLRFGDISISVEGYTIAAALSSGAMGVAIAAGLLLGMLGAIFPAWRATRVPVVRALREVD